MQSQSIEGSFKLLASLCKHFNPTIQVLLGGLFMQRVRKGSCGHLDFRRRLEVDVVIKKSSEI